MTRFMMSLDQAVELVLFAFKNGNNGDIFVQKAPAATIELLAKTLKNILGRPDHKVNIIGTRHGEKLYEALLTREEMVSAQDMGDYYRIPADNRNLNYDKFFSLGEEVVTQSNEYHSHNTHRLNEEELKQMLCAHSPIPAGKVLIDIFMQANDNDGFFAVTRDLDLRQIGDESDQMLESLSGCLESPVLSDRNETAIPMSARSGARVAVRFWP